MPRRDNFDIPMTIERECGNCKSLLTVFQRKVEGATADPPLCPVCNEPFIERDEGRRFNSWTQQAWVSSYRAEYVMVKVKRKGPEATPAP